MQSKHEKGSQYDKYGTRIECRVCKDKNVRFDHHPFDCYRCYKCGNWGHFKRNCVEASFRTARHFPFQDQSIELKPDEAVSIDVENVQGNRKQYPGYVVICRYVRGSKHGVSKVVYAAHITQIGKEIKSYATKWSGLARIDLSERSLEFPKVKQDLIRILSNRTVVGLGLNKDLEVLELTNVVPLEKRFDLNEHFFDINRQPISLKALAFVLLGDRIQEYDPKFSVLTGHDPVVDSRTTIDIYHLLTNSPNRKNVGPLDWDRCLGKLPFPCHQWIRNIIEYQENEGLLPRLKDKRTTSTELITKDFERLIDITEFE